MYLRFFPLDLEPCSFACRLVPAFSAVFEVVFGVREAGLTRVFFFLPLSTNCVPRGTCTVPLLSSVSSEESSLKLVVVSSVPTGPEEPVPTDSLLNTSLEDGGLNPAVDGESVCFTAVRFPLWVADVIFPLPAAPTETPRSDEQTSQGYAHTNVT